MVSAALPADAGPTTALWQACGLTRPWNDPAVNFALALTNPTSTILIARAGNTITASVMIGFDGHRGWIYYLAVAPELQRRGLGRLMMSAAEDWLRARNAPKIQLMVRGDNSDARGFYEALGYEVQDVVTIGKPLDG
jgi:ribosomal protein S18 acetylase RimI-like enzyme